MTGEVGVYAIDGTELELLQIIGGLPQNNTQGIVSVGLPSVAPPTAGACSAPTGLTATQIGTGFFQINWNPVPGADRYVLEARLSGGGTPSKIETIFTTTAGLRVIPNREFEYRVRTICTDGSESEFTPFFSFSSGSTFRSETATSRARFDVEIDLRDLEATAAEFRDMTLYPNPVGDLLNVTYRTTTETGMLSIYHVSGQKVAEQPLGLDIEFHQVNVSDLSSGVYLITIEEAGQPAITRQVIKVDNN